MAAKRQATTDLNHDNWDNEEEPQKPGHYREAPTEELKTRVIKRARRRLPEDSNDNSVNPSKSIFSGFSGFASVNNSTATAVSNSPFAFLSKLPTSTTSPTNTLSTISTVATVTAKAPMFSSGSGGNKNEKNNSENKSKDQNVYFSRVMKLNKSFSDWISKHVDDQPLCDLSPTFKDYEKHFKEIQKNINQKQNTSNLITPAVSTSPTVVTAAVASTTTTASSTSFLTNFKPNSTSTTSNLPLQSSVVSVTSSGKNSKEVNDKGKEENTVKANGSSFIFTFKPTEKVNGSVSVSKNFSSDETTKTNGEPQSEVSKKSTLFQFGPATTKPTKTDPPPGFSFGLKGDTKPPQLTGFNFGLKTAENASKTGGFSFMSGVTPFTFSNIKPPAAEAPKEEEGNGDGEGDNDDEPPKVEIKEIVEEDALYTKRCKVFVKKDNAYKDHGVGTFYLKPIKDSEKVQLLVRSSNTLGTVLINVILAQGMLSQRMGKNNVMLAYPNAEDGKTQTTLFRVKDGAEADELLEMINKHKK